MAMQKKIGLLMVLITAVLSVSSAFSTCSAAPADDWLMFRHDASHSGAADANGLEYPKLLWNYTAHAAIASSPSVNGNFVFVGSKDYNLYCLNAENGQLAWNFTTAGEVDSSPAIYEGCVYVGSVDGWVYCLNITTGMPIWVSLAGGYMQSSPAVVDGCVFIGSCKHDLYCFNASTGALVWLFPTTNPVKSSPAVCEGVVYVATNDFHVYAVNASTGNQIWRQPTGTQTSSPTIHNGSIYIGSYDGYVYCLNASTGSKIWQYRTEGCVNSSPAVANGCVYVGSDDNNVYCFNASSGEKLWRYPTGYWVRSSPTVADGMVYVGSEDYSIYCLNASTGEKQWSIETGSSVDSSPAIVNGVLYVGSSDYNLYAFSLNEPTNDVQFTQSANIQPATTVLFDALAFSVLAAITFATIYPYYSAKKAEQKSQTSPINKKPWFSAHTDAICVLVLLAFSTIFFINLSNSPLWASDEQTYAQWGFHMFKSGDYITPWAFGTGAIWIGKPPLFMWLISLAYQVFGATNFSTRIWSPIFGALTLVFVFYLGKALFNRYVGFLSALVLGTFSTFYMFAQHAMTDGAFVCFIVGSVYFFVLSEKTEKTNRYVVLSCIFFGLALLTKQVEALLIPLIVFVYLLASKRSVRFLFSKRFTVFWGLGALMLLPWVLYMFASMGTEFWQWFVMFSGVLRITTPLENHAGGPLFYFTYLANKETLWAILLPFAGALCIFNSVFKKSKKDLLLLAWMAIVLLLFTFAQTKLEWYILPVLPAFALAISSLLYQTGRYVYLKSRKPRDKVESAKA
jgi:eukaryotic-like serine/threonine-protein kinase